MSSRDTISPLTETSTGVSSPGKDGQHCSGVPYQQTRVKQKQDLVSLPARASNTVRTEQIDNPIKAPTRPPQHMGRLPLSESPSENGVSLSPQSFQQLRTLLYPVIDLFVHPGNAKLPAFGCPFPFPSATVVDALATNWYRWKRIYLFPPPHLIQACLQKLRDFRGSALVIVPVLPSAPWWPEFRLVCTPLDVDLDIGLWVQGEWLKA